MICSICDNHILSVRKKTVPFSCTGILLVGIYPKIIITKGRV